MLKSHRLFPFLLFSFLVVSAVFSLSLSNISKKRVVLEQKAVEEQQQLPVSQWVPIDLASFNQEIDKETAEITEELNQLPSQGLSAKDKTKRQDVLQRSLQIKQITKEEHNLMDEDKDGKIDYQEFNLGTAELYARTYPLMHTGIEGKTKGIFDQKNQKVDQTYLNTLNQTKPQSNNRFLIVVEAGLYDPANPEQSPIKDGLRQYISDILAEGKYLPEIFSCNNCLKEEIRNVLKTPGVAGTVFIGDLPSAWYEYFNTGANTLEIFPLDIYFMLVNSDWGPEKICSNQPPSAQRPAMCFYHPLPLDPVIFFGRLATPSEKDEVELLNNYFRKNHLYRTNKISLPKKALIYVDDEFADAGLAGPFSNQVGLYYSDRTTIIDNEQTNASDYRSRFDDDYEHILLVTHSSFNVHSFYVPSLGGNTHLGSDLVKDEKPHTFFYNLYACDAALYTAKLDYFAGWYTFQMGDYGLETLGSTKLGPAFNRGTALLLGYRAYYDYLKSFKNFGEAFKHWLWSLATDMENFGGMTLIGDPTLTLKCQLPATPERISGPLPAGLVNYGDPVLQIRDTSEAPSCFPHQVVYSVWPPEESATAYHRSSGFLTNNPISSNNRVAVPWTVSPSLPPGRYQWRANLKNSAGQALTKDQVLKVNFTVCSQPSSPVLDMFVYGDKTYQGEPVVLHPQENLTIRIKDVSDRNTSCFPHDVIFNIWPRGATMYVKSSDWMTGNAAIHGPQGTKEWTFRGPDLADLPYGEYELRANLDNKSLDRQGNQRTISSRAPQPLIINFTLAERPTPTNTPTPTPTPWHTICKRTLSGHVACMKKSGEGENKCSTDLNCETCADSVYRTCTDDGCAADRVCRKGEDNYCACYQE